MCVRDLKIFFEFLEHRNWEFERIDVTIIREYMEYLRLPDERIISVNVESKRTPATINRMIGTVYGFYCYQSAMNGITNPIITKDVNSPNSIFRGMLYHTRKSNYTKQSIFKIKASDYHVHLFTTNEIQKMYKVLPTVRDTSSA
jgi:hypothetical protein